MPGQEIQSQRGEGMSRGGGGSVQSLWRGDSPGGRLGRLEAVLSGVLLELVVDVVGERGDDEGLRAQ